MADRRQDSDRPDKAQSSWVPKTRLGMMVKSGEITTMSAALATKLPLREPQIVDALFADGELNPHAHMTSGRYFRRADSVESIATHLPVPRSNASLKILSPSVSFICPLLSSFFLDRIYKIVFKQVEQEIQESLSPPSAGSGGQPQSSSCLSCSPC